MSPGRKLHSRSYFVSYNRADLSWAEWIAWVIESTGYRTVIQAWDFLPGQVWTEEMHRAAITCDVTVCVLSPDFLKSGFTAAEWQAAFADDPTGTAKKVLPIRVRECKPDGLLKARIYVDLVGKTRDEAERAVRSSLSEERAKPASEPRFPGSEAVEPPFPETRIRYALVLEGTFEHFSRDRVEALSAHLRQLLMDGSATITELRAGSVIVIVEGTLSSFQRLRSLKNETEELELAGSRLLACWQLPEFADMADPIGHRLSILQHWMRSYFATLVPREMARDLAQDVILEILSSNSLRFAALDSPALVAQLAETKLAQYRSERARETEARSHLPQNPMPRPDVLGLSMKIYGRLSGDEKNLLENYWDSRFEGDDRLDPISDEVKAVQDRLDQELRIEMEDSEEL